MSGTVPTGIIVGVDTHKHTHAAVALTGLGARVAELTIKVGLGGYRELEAWARSLGSVRAFGIEGTGSYGAGLARFLREAGHVVHEVGRPDRRLRRRRGKTDHPDAEAAGVIVGVDTHKHVHAAVAINVVGARLGTMTVPANSKGYRALEAWARSLGSVRAFGGEGTGSYGAGLSRFLCEQGHAVVEVNRPDRQLRHRKGKSDTVDAESAARAVLGGQATALPKSGTSAVEMIRHLKVARDTAVKARSQAMLTLKAVIISAPSALRERLEVASGDVVEFPAPVGVQV